MYVCVCLAITEEEVTTAIEAGASTVGDVTRACSAGGDCGACHEMIEGMIDTCRRETTSPGLRETYVQLRRTRAA